MMSHEEYGKQQMQQDLIKLCPNYRITSLRKTCSYSEVEQTALIPRGIRACPFRRGKKLLWYPGNKHAQKANTDPGLLPKTAKQACNCSMHLLSSDCLHIIKHLHPKFPSLSSSLRSSSLPSSSSVMPV